MSYMFLHYLGGIVYWIFVKFCKTKLDDEYKNEHIERNIFTFLVSVLVIGFIVIKIF